MPARSPPLPVTVPGCHRCHCRRPDGAAGDNGIDLEGRRQASFLLSTRFDTGGAAAAVAAARAADPTCPGLDALGYLLGNKVTAGGVG
jgi:hypothetical protein